jgi:hypothetical protein
MLTNEELVAVSAVAVCIAWALWIWKLARNCDGS